MTVDLLWSESFFDDTWTQMHLRMRTRESIERETKSIVAVLDRPRGSRIVDVPCGPCDHAIELARRGFEVTGVDLSAQMLQCAQQRVEQARVKVHLLEGDMRSFRSHTRSHAVICMWGSFGYFDEAGNRAQLETFREMLAPGGVLLLDVVSVETLLPRFQARDWNRVGDLVITQERRYDHERQRIDGTWTFLHHGRTHTRSSSMRLYTYREATALLADVGFVDIEGLDPETLGPFSLGASQLWMRAVRPR